MLTKGIDLPTLKKGDKVRISSLRTAFPRGYHEGWSQEFFFIDKIIQSIPIRYALKDYLGEKIIGSFYEPELTKISKKSRYKI